MTKEIGNWNATFCERFNLPYGLGLEDVTWVAVFGGSVLYATCGETIWPDRTLKICQLFARPCKTGVEALVYLREYYFERLRTGFYSRMLTDVLYDNFGMRRRVERLFGLSKPFAVVYSWDKGVV